MSQTIEFEIRGDAADPSEVERLLREQFETFPELRVESSVRDHGMGMSAGEIAITFVVSLLASAVAPELRTRLAAAVRAAGDATGTNLRLLFPLSASAEDVSAAAPGALRTEKVRILFLAANSAADSLDLEREFSRIEENLALSGRPENVELKQVWAVTVDRLIRALLAESPTIVHFSGHGSTRGIILRDETGQPSPIRSGDLASLFELFRGTLQCVVLNACYSEAQARAIRRHVPHVIGLPSAVDDAAAIAFSTGFYQAVGAGKSISFAYELGVKRVRLEGEDEAVLPILV